MTTIHARPERTTTEIIADEQAATEFWKGLPKNTRDRDRLVERESFDYKLLMCDREGREWASRQRRNDTAGRRARRAARIAADPLAHRRDENLRNYVATDTKAQMPRIALHGRSRGERAKNVQSTYHWFRGINTWAPEHVQRVLRDAEVVFEHWLLNHPQYGPHRVGPDLFPHTTQTWNYIPGQIRPAGMTPERALQIALTVLDEHDGQWPDAPPQLP